MKKVLPKILLIAFGLAITVIWIRLDPGFTYMFHDIATVWITIIPIPGDKFGYFVQVLPALTCIMIAWLY